MEGLRGCLALWVAIAHAVCWVGWADLFTNGPIGRAWIHLAHAQEAVAVFIILSGFAIWNLLSSSQPSWREFMIGRFFRLYPVYLLALLLGVLTSFVQRDLFDSLAWADDGYFPTLRRISAAELAQPLPHIGLHLLLLNGTVPTQWMPYATSTFLVPAWSLSIEWQFYLVAPFIWRWRRSLLTWGVLLAAFLACGPFIKTFTNPQPSFLPFFLPAFCVGIASAAVWMRDDASTASRRWMQTAVAGLLLGVFAILRWNPIALFLWILAFGSVAQWWEFLPPARWCRQLLQSPPLQWLGAISYPLYLLHWPLLVGCIWALTSLRRPWSPGEMLSALAVTYLPLSLFSAWMVHRWIEKPGIRLGRSLCPSGPRSPSREA